ncbi:hypothetical protein DUI87_23270 [Hirundo rustica rustica]|uniref:Uncharacterized protein n=1 Tax=Hirundo rustica rustica TaxID=333673 RepID=A0A3M0JIB7_HIRRU|nr:hypothetical protein DUI87_23270 [Hirundo rustica rustica]
MVTPPPPMQPIPEYNHPFCEEIPYNVQPKLALAQLEMMFSCPVTGCLGEEANSHLATTSFQVVVESGKVSSKPPPA